MADVQPVNNCRKTLRHCTGCSSFALQNWLEECGGRDELCLPDLALSAVRFTFSLRKTCEWVGNIVDVQPVKNCQKTLRHYTSCSSSALQSWLEKCGGWDVLYPPDLILSAVHSTRTFSLRENVRVGRECYRRTTCKELSEDFEALYRLLQFCFAKLEPLS